MSNAPSQAYRQHVEGIDEPRVDAASFRQGWRVRSRLDGLLADGLITAAQWQAGCEYRDACMRGVGGQASFLAEHTGGGDADWRMVGQLDRAERVAAVNAQLGELTARLLFGVLVLDRSWRDLGRWLRCDREVARRAAVLALCALGALWGHDPPGEGLQAVQGASKARRSRPTA